jgi:hypothetical protein
MVYFHFIAPDELYRFHKNNFSSMRNKHISSRQNVTIHEFFIVFEKCGREEILKAAELLLQFSIIL